MVGHGPLVTAAGEEAAELFSRVFSPGQVSRGRPNPRTVSFKRALDEEGHQWADSEPPAQLPASEYVGASADASDPGANT